MVRMLKVCLVAMVAAGGVVAGSEPADAKGCIKGAIVGGIAGHMAGHGVMGAAAGCAVGHHMANTRERERMDNQVPLSRYNTTQAPINHY